MTKVEAGSYLVAAALGTEDQQSVSSQSDTTQAGLPLEQLADYALLLWVFIDLCE